MLHQLIFDHTGSNFSSKSLEIHTIKFSFVKFIELNIILNSISAFGHAYRSAMECGYARYVGGLAARVSRVHVQGNVSELLTVVRIYRIMRFLKVGDPSITSEASLLLAHAGMF
jgi:hypothetical protein